MLSQFRFHWIPQITFTTRQTRKYIFRNGVKSMTHLSFIMIVSFGTNLMLHPFYKDIVVVDLLFIGLKTLHLWLNKKNRMVVLRRS